ncbi:MAG: hypothetical protein ABIF82_03615 [Planctomycetota bacterium]
MGRRDFDCEERVLTDLHFVDRAVRHGDREFRLGNRTGARHDYEFAHGLLRRAIGTAVGCDTLDRIRDHRAVLRQLTSVANRFERFEELLEG